MSNTILLSIYFASIGFEILKSSKTSSGISTFGTISIGQFVTFSIDHFHMPIWLNGYVFVYKVIVCGVESRCSHINFRYCVCFEQGVPWNPDNYIVWIHSETHAWHDKNIQSSKHWSIRSLLNIILDKYFSVFRNFVTSLNLFLCLQSELYRYTFACCIVCFCYLFLAWLFVCLFAFFVIKLLLLLCYLSLF